ncbi:MAG: hypothetical protein ABSD53_02935 [Terriglobales bacterium]
MKQTARTTEEGKIEMRLPWLSPLLVFFMFSNAGVAQHVTSIPVRDAQALGVLQKVVIAAGGLQAIDAFQSYSAVGQIIFHAGDEKTEGEATVKWKGTKDFRIDAQMPDGNQWWFIKDGRGFKKEADGTVRPLLYQEALNIQSYCWPLAQVAQAIRDSKVGISSEPLSVRHGRPVLSVRVRPAPEGLHAELLEKQFYVDASTFQIITVEDKAYPRDRLADGIHRSVTFSDYRELGGISFPFSISEDVAHHRHLMEIHLKTVSINAALSDRDFEP